jgi:methionine-rich copper-binding protein CopC
MLGDHEENCITTAQTLTRQTPPRRSRRNTLGFTEGGIVRSQLTRWILIALIIMATVASASAGDVYVVIKENVSDDQVNKIMNSLDLKWRRLESKLTMVAITADDDNDVKIRDILLKQPIVEQAYVVIATRNKVCASGIVEYLGIEGGFWGVIGDDGEHYDLGNMPEKFKKQGLRIKFCGKPINAASIRMWGTMVNVSSIEEIGEDQKAQPAN